MDPRPPELAIRPGTSLGDFGTVSGLSEGGVTSEASELSLVPLPLLWPSWLDAFCQAAAAAAAPALSESLLWLRRMSVAVSTG